MTWQNYQGTYHWLLLCQLSSHISTHISETLTLISKDKLVSALSSRIKKILSANLLLGDPMH